MNLSATLVNMASSPAIYAPVAMETRRTITVSLIVSFLVGQTTLLSSALDSCTYVNGLNTTKQPYLFPSKVESNGITTNSWWSKNMLEWVH